MLTKKMLNYINYCAAAIFIAILSGITFSQYFNLNAPVNGVSLSSLMVTLTLAVGAATYINNPNKKNRILTCVAMILPLLVSLFVLFATISVFL